MPKQKAQTFLKGVRKSSEQKTKPTTIIRIQRMRFYVASVSASTEFGYSQFVLCFNLNAMAFVSASTEFARTDLLVATTLLWHVS